MAYCMTMKLRGIQLVAREAVLRQLIENAKELPFQPKAKANSKRVLESLHEEVVREMKSLGLVEME